MNSSYSELFRASVAQRTDLQRHPYETDPLITSFERVVMKTDKQLQEDVLAELDWESSVNAAHIGVEVDQGVVTLSGHVDTYAEKWGAERAAKRVKGTRAVAIELDVKLRSTEKRTDSDVALSAVNAMQWLSTIPKDTVHVTVENGMITLSGNVVWNYQRDAAMAAVRNLSGVRGVINQILVKPRVNVTAIKSDIEAALKRHAILDAQQIAVSLDGDTITLSGKAPNWTEKNLAINAAWNSPGVRYVVDKIVMS